MSTGQDRGLRSPVSRPLSPAGASCRPNPTEAGGQRRGGVRREPDGRAKSTGPAEHPCNLGSLAHNVFKVEARKLNKQTKKPVCTIVREISFRGRPSSHILSNPQLALGRGPLVVGCPSTISSGSAAPPGLASTVSWPLSDAVSAPQAPS